MTHDTLLDDKDGMQEQLKRIMEDFSKLAPERQQAIIKKIGEKVKDKMVEQFKKLEDEFLDILPGILEEIESKQDGKQGGG
jgi:hypothetical protein